MDLFSIYLHIHSVTPSWELIVRLISVQLASVGVALTLRPLAQRIFRPADQWHQITKDKKNKKKENLAYNLGCSYNVVEQFIRSSSEIIFIVLMCLNTWKQLTDWLTDWRVRGHVQGAFNPQIEKMWDVSFLFNIMELGLWCSNPPESVYTHTRTHTRTHYERLWKSHVSFQESWPCDST